MNMIYYAKDREPNRETISAKEFLDDVCGMMAEKARQLNVEFRCDFEDGINDFEADPQAVRSMLVNLLENSFDACRIDTKKDSHRVTIRLKGDTDKVFFEFEDNGIGMDRESREKAFSMFFSSKGAGGTGLGLFISNKIAQAHGGRIDIESEEGVGSRFIVTIPRRRPAGDNIEIKNSA